MQPAAAGAQRLEQQLRFLLEMDKLKSILRQSPLLAVDRFENSAEHSWHIALMAVVLAEHAAAPVDICRVVTMLLVHDIVEIDAGDTFAYDPRAAVDKAEREIRAADHLFGLLPADQAAPLRSLWEEFEAAETAEARFANAVDRLMPALHNYHSGGGSWQRHHVTLPRVVRRLSPIADGSPALWEYVKALLDDAVARGFLQGEDASHSG